MSAVCQGDHAAFAILVRRHTPKFHTLAYHSLQDRDLADEALQSAFIKLWQRPDSWDGKKSMFTTWFYRVVINACHDLRRTFKNTQSVDESAFDLLLPPSDSEQRVLEESQQRTRQEYYLELAISRLPASQRDALNLVVYSSLPQREVAEILGLSVKAVESLLVRAKRSLRKHIAQYQEENKPLSALKGAL